MELLDVAVGWSGTGDRKRGGDQQGSGSAVKGVNLPAQCFSGRGLAGDVAVSGMRLDFL